MGAELLYVPLSALDDARAAALERGFAPRTVDDEWLSRRVARMRERLGPTLGAAPPAVAPFDWIAIPAVADEFSFYGWRAYAIHAYLADTLTVDWAKKKLAARGWTVGYTWTQGQPSRGLYPIDDSIVALGPAPSGFIRVYGEADAPKAGTNAPAPLGDVAPSSFSLPWPLGDYYAIGQVWELEPATVAAPCPPAVASCPPPPKASTASTLVPAAIGLAVGGLAGFFVPRFFR